MRTLAISLLVCTACSLLTAVPDDAAPAGASGAGGNVGGGGSAGEGGNIGGSGAGGGQATCAPIDGIEIDGECGVFVGIQAGEGDLGTKTNPYLSVQEALGSLPLSGGDIYICDDVAETGSFDVPDGVRIWGKLRCATYAYDSTSKGPTFTGIPDEPVFRVDGDATLFGVTVSAVTGTQVGASSLGVVVIAGKLSLRESVVSAASGVDGGGSLIPPGSPQAVSGMFGTPGCDGSSTSNLGGIGGSAGACASQPGSGGAGGSGQATMTGQAGSVGGPNGTGGAGGVGQSSAVPCANGLQGGNGASGAPGEAVSKLGTVSETPPYYVRPTSKVGSQGDSGAGGGGGGGGKQCAAGSAGPGGGGGGAGGCGGLGGSSGEAGGASFGILLLGTAELDVSLSVISASQGGAGGDGASGQPGGIGGASGQSGAGNASGIACAGGAGGTGGDGGPGAGGPGGPSAAIVTALSNVVVVESTELGAGPTSSPGLAAPGGLPGLVCFSAQILNLPEAACQ